MKKDFVFYPFIFAIYPILFFLGHNQLWFSTFNISLCSVFLIISIGLFFLINFFIKDKHKSALVLSFGITLFYQGGGNLRLDYSIIIAISVFILAILLSYLVLKTKKDLSAITSILNFVAVTLLFISAITIFQGQYEIGKLTTFKGNKEVEKALNNKVLHKIKTKELPNIYYIIPDEYAGFDSLKKYYNFDNKQFQDFLNKKQFYVVPNATSNYCYTAMSVNSSLNMGYVDYFPIRNLEDENALNHILDNNLIKLLKAYDYDSVIIVNEWHLLKGENKALFKKWDKVLNPIEINPMNETILFRQTLLRFVLSNYIKTEMRKERHKAFNFLDDFSQIKKNKPQFVYFHILMPHNPCIFDENGNTPINTGVDFYKYLYVRQIKYTNKLIENSINNILKNDNNAVIIIQSDHGSRDRRFSKKEPNVKYNNLTAIYIPEKYRDKVKLYPTITPVNIFRVILNPILNLNLKLLKDEKIKTKHS